MKICVNCGVVVKDSAVLLCPDCGAGEFKNIPQETPKPSIKTSESYYDDVEPEDAGQVQKKQNNAGLYVKIGLVCFVVAIIVSVCAVVAFMM